MCDFLNIRDLEINSSSCGIVIEFQLTRAGIPMLNKVLDFANMRCNYSVRVDTPADEFVDTEGTSTLLN